MIANNGILMRRCERLRSSSMLFALQTLRYRSHRCSALTKRVYSNQFSLPAMRAQSWFTECREAQRLQRPLVRTDPTHSRISVEAH